MNNTVKYAVGIALFFGIYLVLAMPSLHEPLLGDSFASPASAEDMYAGREFNAYHPALYYVALGTVIHFKGHSIEWYRAIGILGFLLTLCMVMGITRMLSGDLTTSMIAGFLYAINPLAVKGSFITDIDTTVLPPLLLLFIIVFCRLRNRADAYAAVVLGLLLALALWAKETTPLLFVPSVAVYYFLRREYRRGIAMGAGVLAAGGTVFLITWWLSPYVIPGTFSTFYPFRNLLGAFNALNTVTGSEANYLYTPRSAVRFALWLSPGLLVLFCLSLYERSKALRQGVRPDRLEFLAVYASLLLILYFFIGNIAFSFPKYHYPFVSVACILAALTVTPRIRRLNARMIALFVLLFAALTAFNTLAVGDILYSTDYSIREAMATGTSVHTALSHALLQLLLYAGAFIAAFFILWAADMKNGVYVALLGCAFISLLSANISLDILQYRAGYTTVYCYGANVNNRLFDYLQKQKAAGKRLLVPDDIGYHVGMRELNYSGKWSTPDRFLNAIKTENVDCIVYGISSNTVQQFAGTFNNGKVVAYLTAGYTKQTYGSYTLWEKRLNRT